MRRGDHIPAYSDRMACPSNAEYWERVEVNSVFNSRLLAEWIEITQGFPTSGSLSICLRIFLGFPTCQWTFNQAISDEIDNSDVSDWQICKALQHTWIKSLWKIYYMWKATGKYLWNRKVCFPFYTAISLQGVYPLGTTHTGKKWGL